MHDAEDVGSSQHSASLSPSVGDAPSRGGSSSRHWFYRDPPWLIRDGLLALVIGALLVGVQFYLDERRSDREQSIESGRAALAERLENLRYVRERADTRTFDGIHYKSFDNFDLAGMNFAGLRLSQAVFWGANLNRTDFSTADLTGASFGSGDLPPGSGTGEGAIFKKAKLWNAVFSGWDGDGADFSSASLLNARFTEGSYVGTNFAKADLTGAHLANTDLSQALNIDSAYFRDGCYFEVIWPAGFEEPSEKADCF